MICEIAPDRDGMSSGGTMIADSLESGNISCVPPDSGSDNRNATGGPFE